MSLDRKDVRAKLSPDMHAALSILAEVEQLDIGEWVERELVRVIHERVHVATVIADRAGRLGIAGNRRESQGIPGNRRESPGISGKGRE